MFRLADFQAYEIRRNAFLQSARGRAALTAGQLIWRLARSAASNQDVLDGPTAEAAQGRNSFVISDATCGEAMWDDELTQEEINLITGTYQIPPGIFIYSSDASIHVCVFP